MRALISATVLAFTLTACGGGGEGESASEQTADPTSEATTSSAAAPTEEPTPEGESTDCLLSATKFADRAGDHALSFATTAPAFGELQKLENLNDLLSEISVLCSPELDQAARKIMDPLTLANYEISTCAFDPDPMFGGCRGPQNNKVHRIGERAAGLVGQFRSTIKG